MIRNHPASRRAARILVSSFASVAIGLALLVWTERADAFVNVGAEVGAVKRSADAPGDLKLGLGFGLHAEVGLLPFINLGPYFLHYQLASDSFDNVDAAFNTLGLRARLVLPLPVQYKPYVFVGAGYAWVNYHSSATVGNVAFSADTSGHFIETPIGVGIAVGALPLLQFSLDVAYRPGLSFGGEAYDTAGIPKPNSGFSVMLGVALDL
jgi:hypothetical protein